MKIDYGALTAAFVGYAEWTPQTSIHKSLQSAVTASILGIGGELNEYFEAALDAEGLLFIDEVTRENLIKELGDVLYYMGLLAYKTSILDEVRVRPHETVVVGHRWCKHVFSLQETYKKIVRDHDGTIHGSDLYDRFVSEYNRLLSLIFTIQPPDGGVYDWELVMETNKEKLLSRLERGVITGSGDNR